MYTSLNTKAPRLSSVVTFIPNFVGERRYHATVPFVIATAALGCMSAMIDENPSVAFLSMLGATVLWGPAGIISALPATFLSGPAAATGVALINSIANIGGMLGPFMVGETCLCETAFFGD